MGITPQNATPQTAKIGQFEGRAVSILKAAWDTVAGKVDSLKSMIFSKAAQAEEKSSAPESPSAKAGMTRPTRALPETPKFKKLDSDPSNDPFAAVRGRTLPTVPQRAQAAEDKLGPPPSTPPPAPPVPERAANDEAMGVAPKVPDREDTAPQVPPRAADDEAMGAAPEVPAREEAAPAFKSAPPPPPAPPPRASEKTETKEKEESPKTQERPSFIPTGKEFEAQKAKLRTSQTEERKSQPDLGLFAGNEKTIDKMLKRENEAPKQDNPISDDEWN